MFANDDRAKIALVPAGIPTPEYSREQAPK